MNGIQSTVESNFLHLQQQLINIQRDMLNRQRLTNQTITAATKQLNSKMINIQQQLDTYTTAPAQTQIKTPLLTTPPPPIRPPPGFRQIGLNPPPSFTAFTLATPTHTSRSAPSTSRATTLAETYGTTVKQSTTPPPTSDTDSSHGSSCSNNQLTTKKKNKTGRSVTDSTMKFLTEDYIIPGYISRITETEYTEFHTAITQLLQQEKVQYISLSDMQSVADRNINSYRDVIEDVLTDGIHLHVRKLLQTVWAWHAIYNSQTLLHRDSLCTQVPAMHTLWSDGSSWPKQNIL